MPLPQYYVSVGRKDLAEKAIIAKRQQEARYNERCESAARYHRELHQLSTRYSNLEDESRYKMAHKIHVESKLIEEAKARRKSKVIERRIKLGELLAKETDEYLAELDAITVAENKDPYSVQAIKEQMEELRDKKKALEEDLRGRGAYHALYQSRVPFALEFEEDKRQKETAAVFEKKKVDLRKESMLRNEEARKMEETLKERRLKVSEEADRSEIEHNELTEKWGGKLDEWKEIIDEHNVQCDKMKLEVDNLQGYFIHLKDAKQSRSIAQESPKENLKKAKLHRPSKAATRVIISEIIKILDLDRKTLQNMHEAWLTNQNLTKFSVDFTRLISTREAISSSINAKHEIELEILTMFEEEIVKLCLKKIQDWDNELNEFNEMIDLVFNDLMYQVNQILVTCLRESKETISSREKLITEYEEDIVKSKQEKQQVLDKKEYLVNRIEELDKKIEELHTASMPKLAKKGS